MRFFPLFLFLFLSNSVQAQYKEIERTAVNEVIVVHCFKDKQLNVSVDTGNLLHLNTKHQIGYMDFKTELEIEEVIGSLKPLAIPWLIYVGPKRKMILSPRLHFEKVNESASAFTALIYRIVKGRIVFEC